MDAGDSSRGRRRGPRVRALGYLAVAAAGITALMYVVQAGDPDPEDDPVNTESVSSLRVGDEAGGSRGPNSDIEAANFRLTRRELVVDARLRAVSRRSSVTMTLTLEDSNGWDREIIWTRRREAGRWQQLWSSSHVDSEGVYDQECDDVTGRLDTSRETVQLRVPSRCLRPPRLVSNRSEPRPAPDWVRITSLVVDGPRGRDELSTVWSEQPRLASSPAAGTAAPAAGEPA